MREVIRDPALDLGPIIVEDRRLWWILSSLSIITTRRMMRSIITMSTSRSVGIVMREWVSE
jgi:hypothetical protein